MKRIELAFRQRSVSPSELDRDIVKPPRCEAAIEMPQSRDDHSGDRDLDVEARLIEDEEIEARALGQVHAGGHLLARVEIAELRAKVRSDGRSAARDQIGMVLQPKWRGVVLVRFLARRVRVPAAHEPDGQKLVELRHRAQRGDSRIEMGAGAKLDKFLRVLRPVRYRHEARNPEVAGDVEHPKATSGFGKLCLQITDVGIVELAEVHRCNRLYHQIAYASRSTSSRNPWTIASSSVLPDAQPLESAWCS